MHSDPSPVLIASSIGMTSLPRTSPTMMRRRFIRSASTHQVRQRDLARAATGGVLLAGALAGLHRDHPRVAVRQLVQVQLVLPLDGGEPLHRGELVRQGADQGGLPRVLQTR